MITTPEPPLPPTNARRVLVDDPDDPPPPVFAVHGLPLLPPKVESKFITKPLVTKKN